MSFKLAYPRNAIEFQRALGRIRPASKKVRYTFEYPIARWLCASDPDNVAIDWPRFKNEDRLQSLLPIIAGLAEEPGIDDENVSTRDWVENARGNRSDLVWLINAIERLSVSGRVKAHFFDQLELPLVWTPKRPKLTIERPVHFHAELRKRVDLAAEIKLAPVAITRGSEEIIQLAKTALTLREREMYPISHANTKDVTLYTLENGLEIACIGILPERRMFLEGLWGYLFIKNGVPIGYGCFSALFESAEVAFNIFDDFRGGESAVTYASLLRVIHHHTGATSFTAMRYQFGYENDEAIESGAFWFYHKLGFRPLDRKHAQLVDTEYRKVKSQKGYRSSSRTLKLLATENLFFSLGKENLNVLGWLNYAKIGHAITKQIAGDPERAIAEARRSIGVSLPSSDMADQLALYFSLMSPRAWSRAERNALYAIAAAKSNPAQEREFTLLMNQHASLKRSTWKFAAKDR